MKRFEKAEGMGFCYHCEASSKVATPATVRSVKTGRLYCAEHADAIRQNIKNAKARARHQAMTDLGMVRVRGSLGGVYYE